MMGMPFTINDEQTILTCDGSICVPCMGTPVDCNTGPTIVVPCDDGDPCTENDEQTILDSDGTICEPCMGIAVDCATGETTAISCDDGDPNTFNDIQVILACDGSICLPCMGSPCNIQAAIQLPGMPLTCESLDNGVLLQGSASTPGTDVAYEWVFEGVIIGTTMEIVVFNEGVYTLVVTDNEGCTSSAEAELVAPVVDLIPFIGIIDESCPELSDGLVLIDSVIGGQAPYLFALDSDNFVTSNQFVNLAPGSYQLVIQDANGCEYVEEISINAANELL
jgi:hypothetical protein